VKHVVIEHKVLLYGRCIAFFVLNRDMIPNRYVLDLIPLFLSAPDISRIEFDAAFRPITD
jgi:hypothetical protein